MRGVFTAHRRRSEWTTSAKSTLYRYTISDYMILDFRLDVGFEICTPAWALFCLSKIHVLVGKYPNDNSGFASFK